MRLPSSSSVLVLLVCIAVPALAQEEDEQTRDHEERDRLYRQRHQLEHPAPEEEAQSPEPRREDFLAAADELIRDRNYSSASGEHYRIQTDDPRLRADDAARLLEAFRAFFDGFWSGSAELQPYDETSRAFLFYSFYKFNRLLQGDYRFREFRPKGHYRPGLDVITLHTDAGDDGSVADALIHEAAHQLLTRRLFGDHPAPLWVNEGLATYFGFTLADDQGTFHRAAIGGKSVELLEGVKEAGRERRGGLRSLREGLRASRSETVGLIEQVLSIDDPGVFYGDRAPLHYAASWILVHFLLHGDEGRHADGFLRFLQLDRRGRGGTDALYGELDLGPQALQAEVERYAKDLKAR